MKEYIKSIANQLKEFSTTLDRTSILIDKPWSLIDDDNEIQKLIFKKNQELVLSKNGQVQIGKWEYFSEAHSLLIDRNTDKILCNEAFIDKGVMILKLDGTDNKFFVLANENVIPDLNVMKYLRDLRKQNLKIKELTLSDGKVFEIHNFVEGYFDLVGYEVKIENNNVEDGLYQLKSKEFL